MYTLMIQYPGFSTGRFSSSVNTALQVLENTRQIDLIKELHVKRFLSVCILMFGDSSVQSNL